jgi:uncharacterized integral membrane protein
MRYFSWLLRLVLFVLLLGFAVRNSEPVILNYYLGYQWQAPLVLLIFVFFFAGVVIGAAANLRVVFRQKREILALKKEIRQKGQSAGNNGI